MKKYSLVLQCLFMVACLLFTSNSYAKDEKNKTDKLAKTITLDNKEWKLDWQKEDDNISVGEYVADGESVNNWTQLFTYQYFKTDGSGVETPAKLAENEMDAFKKNGYPHEYYKIIESNDKEAIFEFRITKPHKDVQNEIQRIILAPNKRFIVLHYVAKKPDMGDEERTKWIKALKDINLNF